ncbi:APC family permease [Streptacidiphilus sp. 4-A2]|nr:APC family permease [Streptacidiphilus sp. 4-A2]
MRWPLYTSGRLVATLVGTGIWIAYATNPPSESAAMLQYMSKYVPGLFSGGRLTGIGVLLGLAFMAVFVALNWFGVKLFAHVNLAVTVAKFAVPALTTVLLLATGFHAHNLTGTGHGGVAPYGWSAPLSAIATAGVIYAYTGFQGPIDLAAEARNPRRDIPGRCSPHCCCRWWSIWRCNSPSWARFPARTWCTAGTGWTSTRPSPSSPPRST